MPKIGSALLSVYDKTGVLDFARGLAGMGVELLSTGGSAKMLREAGLRVTGISEWTGFPEILDGRVKTLHPKVHGGLLFRREVEAHRAQAAAHGIEPIDLVAVNLYPFEQTVARPGISVDEAVEQIDIGGPSMLRSAAKNWESVTVVSDPSDYAAVLEELKANGGRTRKETRRRLAAKVFALTSRYDAAICGYLEGLEGDGAPPPPDFVLHAVLRQKLRYGENPHQKAAFYALPGSSGPSIAGARQISGKELSFNNILDLAAALELAREFSEPFACVLKHSNPCGAAVNGTLREAFRQAYAGDPLSAFGGIVGLNRTLDEEVAAEIAAPGRFVEAIVAPGFSREARELLTTKPRWGKNVRLLETGAWGEASRACKERDVRVLPGGLLVQERDAPEEEWADLKTVTRRAPSAAELAALKFAQIVCKHVKSNAIVLARGTAVRGVGAGQMSRVDAVQLAARKAGARGAEMSRSWSSSITSTKAGARASGAVMASDAFFPFPDAVEAAAEAGVTAVIQPGGSRRDAEVIAACDRAGLAMLTTGLRHFRH